MAIKVLIKSSLQREYNYSIIENNQVLFTGVLNNTIQPSSSSNILGIESVTQYTINNITLKNTFTHALRLEITSNNILKSAKFNVTGVYGATTILPVILLILIAITTNQAIPSLFVGLLVGSTIINQYNPFIGILRAVDYYLINALADPSNSQVIFLSFFLSGLVALIQKSQGALGLTNLIIRHIKGSRVKAQFSIYLLGCLIFIDDFASCLIVGVNMLPISDQLFISREKLAFIVHATSSPPSSISPISSWIGFELNLIGTQLKKLGINKEPFVVFLKTIPYRFFPLLMLFFVFVILFLDVDFGPMLSAQSQALNHIQFADNTLDQTEEKNFAQPEPSACNVEKARWYNAVIPIVIVILVTVVSVFVTGYYKIVDTLENNSSVFETSEISFLSLIGSGDASVSLLYSSFFALVTGFAMYSIQGLMTFNEGILSFIDGIKDIVEPMLLMMISWAFGSIFDDLKCAEYIIGFASDHLSEHYLPVLIFMLSCILSFSTGSSWGTMSVVFPLVIPLAYSMSKDEDFIVASIASILTGSIFGDQCSPVSSTSILTALSCQVSVKKHVNTQFLYALVVASTAVLVCYLPIGFQLYNAYTGLFVGCITIVILVMVFGRNAQYTKHTYIVALYRRIRNRK